MFVSNLALPEVPADARIAPEILTQVLTRMLSADAKTLTRVLDAGFREMERRQPSLSTFLADELALADGARVQALGYFLAVLVYQSFEEAFGSRLSVVQPNDLTQMLERLVADGELRHGGAAGASYSEDAIAVGQPAVVSLLRHEVDRTLDEDPGHPEWQQIDGLYEALLVELLVLTQAVGAV